MAEFQKVIHEGDRMCVAHKKKKAEAVAYARGVMDVLRVLVRAQMLGSDEDKIALDEITEHAMNRLRDASEEDRE